jgi:hypothetical protein
MPSSTSRLITNFVGWLMLAGPAYADTFTSKEWGFSATFPGPANQTAQPVKTAVGDVTMVTVYYVNEGDGVSYGVITSDYPKGTITRQPLEQVYKKNAVSAAESVKGTVRSITNFTVDGVVGRDVLIDSAPNGKAAHNRYFTVGDRLFQVIFIGPPGNENAKATLDFLNSFHLLP